jgi:glutaredoxin
LALKKAGVAYQEIDLSRQLEVLRRAKQITGQSTVPQV